MKRVKPTIGCQALSVLLAGAAASGLLSTARAVQDAPGPEPIESVQPNAPHPNVYVHDSFEAEELIAKAVAHAEAGRWLEAGQTVRRIVTQHGDKLTSTGPGQYTSITEHMNDLVASWPPQGLAAYRELTEAEARRRLVEARQGRRLESVLAVADRYFCTRAGAEATLLAAELALESGDFALAAAMYRRLLDKHPDRHQRQADVTIRLAAAYALWGRADDARRLVVQAGPAAAIDWMGRRRLLVDLIETLLAETQPVVGPPAGFTWPTFAGNPRRDRWTSLSVDQMAVLWQTQGVGEGALISDGEQSGNYRRALRKGRLLSMNPVLDGNTIYVQDSRRVWAMQLGSGKLLWSYAGTNLESGSSATTERELPCWYAVEVVGSKVYAVLGSEVLPYYGYEAPDTTSALVCLDAATGELVWKADRASLGPTSDETSFESAPIVSGGKLYVVARRKRAFGFEDCFLCRFDAATGQFQFRTHLGSASTGGFGYRRPTLTIPSLFEDTVYVVSNLGTIAAVDRHTGSVRWLRVYDRISESQWRREGRGASRELSPWQYNPLICTPRGIHALPTDSESLLVLDGPTGAILHDVPIGRLGGVQTLLGVEGSRIYGVGDYAFCFDLESGSYVWQAPLPAEGEVHGRGILTREQLVVPMRTAFCTFDRHTGSASVHPWESPEGGGNVLAVPGQLIVAGNDRVTAYARKGDVLARLRLQMDRRPQDPGAALDLAEVLFRTGDIDESLQALDQAVARAGGFAGPIDADVKRRLYEDCLGFAGQLTEQGDFDLAMVMSLYERASQCPPDTAAHLDYRFRWAELYETAERWADAVALYQQVLADRSLAGADYTPPAGSPEPAGRLAEAAIARIIAERGRQVYARFDAQADEWLLGGRSSGDLDLLARILESYPNSLAAPAALEARADLLRRQGDFLEAARSLYSALARYPKQTDPVLLMRRIADCYRDAGRVKHAWRWLTKAAREHPASTIEADGRPVGLLDYRARLGDLRRQVEPSRPRLGPPLTETYRRDFDQACFLLDARFAEVPAADWRAALVYSDNALHAFDAKTNRQLWPRSAACPVLPELLLASNERLVLATLYRIFCLDTETGRQLWEYGRRPPELDDPDADPEDFAVYVAFAYQDGLLVALRSDGQATALQVESGRCRWERRLDHRPARSAAMNDIWLVYQATRLGRPVFVVLAAAAGEPLRVIDPQDDRQFTHLFFTLADSLILVTSETVHCFDPVSGQRTWRIQLEGDILAGGVALDLDGLYLADDTLRIQKISLNDGRRIWRSESPENRTWRDPEGLTLHLDDGQVLVTSERRVFALGGLDGRILWEGTVRRGTRFRHRKVTDSFLVAVDSPPEHFEEPRAVYFYDLRNASGIIPSDGGVKTLGVFEDVKAVTVRHGALLLQAGRTIHAWTAQAPTTNK